MSRLLYAITSYFRRLRRKHVSFVLSFASSARLVNLRISYLTLQVTVAVLIAVFFVSGYALLYQLGYFGSAEDKEVLCESCKQEARLTELTEKLGELQAGVLESEAFFAKLGKLYDVEMRTTEEVGIGGPILGVDAKLLEDPTIMEMVALYNLVSVGELNGVEVFSRAEEQSGILGSTPSLLPTKGGISSGFGWRMNPLGGGMQFHTGVDINCVLGTPIYAAADGIVAKAGMTGGYGIEVRIKHGFGFSTLYGHCSEVFVTDGQEVKRGDLVAAVGSTGWSTGNHLHYEVRINNVPVDPMGYIVTGYIVD